MIHGRAYELLDIDASYGLADCPTEGDVAQVVERIRSGDLTGANVTVPWKKLAYDLADIHDRTALDVGVANVLSRDSAGRVVAYNTDASALATEIQTVVRGSGVDTTERPGAVILGSGGAAMAAIVGCRMAGITKLFVSARKHVPGSDSKGWPRIDQIERLGAHPVPWFESEKLRSAFQESHLIVQATSAGMKGASGGEELAGLVPWGALAPLAAYDLVYVPRTTPFLERASQAGHFVRGGLGMLVGQARDAIEIWLGRAPTVDELLETAAEALPR